MKRLLAERLLLIAAAFALVATACSAGSGDMGEVITVFGNQRGADAKALRSVLDRFEEETGYRVRFTGSASFPTAMRERVEEGNPPDIGLFPQPGLLRDLADEGYVRPLRDDVAQFSDVALLPSLAAAFGSEDDLPGVLVQVQPKSLVWYSPEAFADHGYVVPTTWEELKALSRKIDTDGFTSWCLGVSSFGASGWPATDWIEDIVLRDAGTDAYDEWVAGNLAFASQPIGAAINEFGNLVLTAKETDGGRRGILNTSPAKAQDPMFASPPGCFMYKMASFQRSNLPPDMTIGPDGGVDVFPLPGRTGEPSPMLIGGTVAAAFTDSDATWALMKYLSTPQAGEAWAEEGGYISPHADFDAGAYRDDFDRRMAALLTSADVVRFDGSDLMYSPVGTRSFFDAMVQYIATDRLGAAQQVADAGYDR